MENNKTTTKWKILKIGNIIEKIQGGGTPSKIKPEYWNGNIPWASVKDIVTHNANDTLDHISELGLKNSATRLVPKGTLIITTRMALGHAVFFNVNVAINQDLKAVYPIKELQKQFLFYWFQSNKKYIARLGTGSTVDGISQDELKNIDLLLPPLPEQEKIVEILETWDEYLEKITNTIKYRKEVKKTLVQKLLTGKLRLCGFKDKWEIKPLEFFIETKLRPILKPESNFLALGIRSHCKGIFQKPDFDPKKIAMETLYIVKKNDLIVNITFAWEGAIAIAKTNDEGGLVSHRFPTHIIKEHIGNIDFFRQFIQTKKFRYLLKLISPGGAGRNRVMSKKDFLKLKIQIPEYKEQTAIAEILATADQEIENLEKKRQLIEAQKKFLLNNLITGKIRLPEFIQKKTPDRD